MRPLLILIVIVLVAASVYYDLNVGTIPHASSLETKEGQAPLPEESHDTEEALSLPSQEVIVEAGQTVYGIVRALHEDDSFTYPPHQVIEDFEALNPNVQAHQIIIGHSYRFPLYPSNEE